jgi:hypothetical protein
MKKKMIGELALDLLKTDFCSVDSVDGLHKPQRVDDIEYVIGNVAFTLAAIQLAESRCNQDSVTMFDVDGKLREVYFHSVELKPIVSVPVDMHRTVIDDYATVICVNADSDGDAPIGLVAGASYQVAASHIEDGLITPMIILKGLEHSGAMFADRFIVSKSSGVEQHFNPC